METLTINLFYPLLFTVIVVLIITIGIVLVKYKDGSLFQNIFYKSSDNAKEITIDTTDKLSKAHTEIVEVKWDKAHEKEMHAIEKDIKDLNNKFETTLREINHKMDILLERVVALEQNR